MLPYLATIGVLVLISRKPNAGAKDRGLRAPQSLGQVFDAAR
jgi:ABC-type uncharacterized transport system permease subunit